MTTEKIEGWVLDYACKFHHHEVIAALHQRYGETLNRLGVPDARLCVATLHRIVYCRELTELETAVQLVEELYTAISMSCPLRVYFRLVYALKMKVLMDELSSASQQTHTLNVKLNKYFPRCGIMDIKTSPKDLEKLQKMVSDFRKFFLSLLTNTNQCKAYLQDDFDAEFGQNFMHSLEKHVTQFIEAVNKYFPNPVIEKMLEKGTEAICKDVPSISASFDILLECLVKKTRLESHDLLDLLTLLHPISTQDRLKPKLHLTFGSDDSSASNDSRYCDLSNCTPDDVHQYSPNKATRQAVQSSCDDHDTHLPQDCLDTDSSQPLTASGESVSLISRRRPGAPSRSVSRPPPHENSEGQQDLSQVYVISSSSDSGSASQPAGQPTGQQEEVLQSTKASESSPSLKVKSTQDEHADTSSFLMGAGDESSTIIPSSHLEEVEDLETDPKASTSSEIMYPSLRQHQKNMCVKLCVVKLYRNQSPDRMLNGRQMKMYS